MEIAFRFFPRALPQSLPMGREKPEPSLTVGLLHRWSRLLPSAFCLLCFRFCITLVGEFSGFGVWVRRSFYLDLFIDVLKALQSFDD